MLRGPDLLTDLAGHVPAEAEDLQHAELGVPQAAALFELDNGLGDRVDLVRRLFVFEFEKHLLVH